MIVASRRLEEFEARYQREAFAELSYEEALSRFADALGAGSGAQPHSGLLSCGYGAAISLPRSEGNEAVCEQTG